MARRGTSRKRSTGKRATPLAAQCHCSDVIHGCVHQSGCHSINTSITVSADFAMFWESVTSYNFLPYLHSWLWHSYPNMPARTHSQSHTNQNLDAHALYHLRRCALNELISNKVIRNNNKWMCLELWKGTWQMLSHPWARLKLRGCRSCHDLLMNKVLYRLDVHELLWSVPITFLCRNFHVPYVSDRLSVISSSL